MSFANLNTKPKIFIGVMVPQILLLVLGGITVSSLATILETNKWVDHTRVVLAEVGSIVGSAVDMETGMRGFLLAGQDEFLEPYNSGNQAIFAKIKTLQATVSDNPKQVARLNEATGVLTEWRHNVTEPAIAARREVGAGKTMGDIASLVGEARGKVYFDKFRGIMADFAADEEKLMHRRKQDNEATVSATYTIIVVCIIVGLFVGLIIALFIGGQIAGPIVRMTESMGELAGGNKKAEIPGRDRQDEIGDMAAAVQVFKENMILADKLSAEQDSIKEQQESIKAEQAKEVAERVERAKTLENLAISFDSEVTGIIGHVSSAADEMGSTAASMSTNASEASAQALGAAASSEQASTNVQSVASATQELSSSISSIGRQVAHSSTIAAVAVDHSQRVHGTIRGLVESAQQIDKVVNLITDIADQTNLLALNATIEAASAGDAGRGFAVVASEVKNLAKQTAKATDEISGQIQAVQAHTEEAAKAISTITKVIEEINEISSAISLAVGEQDTATAEIARNVEEASLGTTEVASYVAQMTQTAGETGQSANDVNTAVKDLSGQTESLNQVVRTFLSNVRAA